MQVRLTEAFSTIASRIQALASTTCLPWPNQVKRATSCSVLKHKPTSTGWSDKHDYNTYAELLGPMLVEGAR